MTRHSITSLAQRQSDAYKTPGHLNYKFKIKGDNALAYLQHDGTLVIVGSNDPVDWFHNLALWSVQGSFYEGFRTSAVQTARWHAGFLRHAHLIVTRLGTTRPKCITGHSLGGAVAQILSVHYTCPAVTFAAPKACQNTISHSQHLNLIYKDDPVPDWPDTGGFYKRVGTTKVLPSDGNGPWPNHNMTAYMPRLVNGMNNGLLPKHWP